MKNVSATAHWGSANLECSRELLRLGMRLLTGYFEFYRSGESLVSYYADKGMTAHIVKRDFFYDTNEDIIFGRIDRVLNSVRSIK